MYLGPVILDSVGFDSVVFDSVVRENERPQTANFEDPRVHSSTYTNQVYIMCIYSYFTCIQMKYIIGIDINSMRVVSCRRGC